MYKVCPCVFYNLKDQCVFYLLDLQFSDSTGQVHQILCVEPYPRAFLIASEQISKFLVNDEVEDLCAVWYAFNWVRFLVDFLKTTNALECH